MENRVLQSDPDAEAVVEESPRHESNHDALPHVPGPTLEERVASIQSLRGRYPGLSYGDYEHQERIEEEWEVFDMELAYAKTPALLRAMEEIRVPNVDLKTRLAGLKGARGLLRGMNTNFVREGDCDVDERG